MPPLRILAISGSLRERSSNREVLHAVARVGGERLDVRFFDDLATLPHFNPDDDAEGAVLPAPVVRFRAAIAAVDALIVSSPEYAHGVPGAFKNALDWLVSGPEMVGKIVGLFNASARSAYAHPSIAETLRTMSAVIPTGADVVVPLDGQRWSATRIAEEPALVAIIVGALESIRASVEAPQG